jgi:glycosyltransferase involved in cell wall biosynthesis
MIHMDNELISVIIPTYNRVQLLKRAVASVIDQSYRNIELIIVDDGSTDDTSSFVRSVNRDIHYIAIPHSGVSAARNRGIEAAAGTWIAFLDSDDYWLKDKLERQLHYVHTVHPEIPSHEHYFICHTDEIWIRKGKRINPGKKHSKHAGWFFVPSLHLCLISPSAVMIHSSLFERVGLFDEDFEFVEDYDLWLRITASYPVGYLNEALTVKHGGHDDQLSGRIDGIEKYRIRALEKIISCGNLCTDFLEEALQVYHTKASIYMEGCTKRGKHREAEKLQARMQDLLTRASTPVENQEKGFEPIDI